MNDATKVDYKDLIYTYINVLVKRIAFMESKHCSMEPMSGCIFWEAKGDIPFVGKFDCVYATPFWENEDGIPVQLMNDAGDVLAGDMIPFPMSELTMDLQTDVKRYCDVLRKFMKEKCNVTIPPQHTLADL